MYGESWRWELGRKRNISKSCWSVRMFYQNLCASLLTERTRGQRGCWEILVAVQLRGTGVYPLAMLIGREKGRKTNLMRSDSAWASANDGLHLTQQQCEQQSSGRDREHVTPMILKVASVVQPSPIKQWNNEAIMMVQKQEHIHSHSSPKHILTNRLPCLQRWFGVKHATRGHFNTLAAGVQDQTPPLPDRKPRLAQLSLQSYFSCFIKSCDDFQCT